MKLGTAIQVRQAQLRIKRPELARRVGISYPYMSEIVTDKKLPTLRLLEAIAIALQMKTSELMDLAERCGEHQVIFIEELEPPMRVQQWEQ